MEADSIHTIIVGSGIAGITAANQIAKRGHKVLVLQANNYIGGRIKTTNLPLSNNKTFAYDQGASWIHGSNKKHPITKLAKQMGTISFVQTDDDKITSFDTSRKQVSKQTDKQYDEYQKLLQKSQEMKNMSIQQAFNKMKPQKLKNKFFMHHVSNDIEFNTSASINDISAYHGQQDSQFDGRQMLIINGYQAIPEHLAKHENIKVLLNNQVVEIESSQIGSKVKCINGAIFQGINVIIAIPLGPLKNNSIKFIPQLPSWKYEAISKIHFGNVCKILIGYSGNLIKLKQHYISIIEDDIQKRGSATYYLNISALTGLPAIMTFGLGANADQLQFMPEHQLKILIASRLSLIANQKIDVNDFHIARTGWRGNPNFCGTYSYAGVQTFPIHWKNMAKPIFQRKIYFCGEHTSSKYRGTVHGAYLSGKDAAICLLDNIHENAWKYRGKQESDSESSSSQDEKEKNKNNKGSNKNQQRKRKYQLDS